MATLKVIEWESRCIRWRGRILTGVGAHCCFDWDGLPVDETTDEWGCCSDLPPEMREAGERARLGVGVIPDPVMERGESEPRCRTAVERPQD